MNVLKFSILHDNTFYSYILFVTFFHLVSPHDLHFANFVSSVYLKPKNNEIYEINTKVEWTAWPRWNKLAVQVLGYHHVLSRG